VIVIHETLEGRGDDEEVNVLFVDGHVDRITVARVRKMLSATNEGP
jgi:prepilin-type processing-associated H-X9-DG protein